MTKTVTTIKLDARLFYYADCTCGYHGSPCAERRLAARDWESHMLLHHRHLTH